MIIFSTFNKKIEMKRLNFSTAYLPYSSDPLNYDDYAHHYTFTSVFAGLVSIQRIGEIRPLLASEWRHDNGFKEWKFKIRQNLQYSNGDKITTEDVYLNFRRVAYLMKVNNSKSGLLEFVLGFDGMKNMADPLEGIQKNADEIIFRFNKAMPDVLERISFGFYSLAHPSLYEKSTGKWVDDKKSISSGAYEVSEWTDHRFILKLRKDIPYISYENNIDEIVFSELSNIKDSNDLKTVSMLVADSESLIVDENFEYVNSPVGLNIQYVQCFGCEKKDNPLSHLAVRKWFRNRFYENLKKSGYRPVHSFFPLILKGVKDINIEQPEKKPTWPDFNLVTHKYTSHVKIKENENKKAVSEYIASAIYNLEKEDHVKLILEKYDNTKKFSDFDLIALGTGIEASDYMETVKFMFLSQHGINLPDINGKIKDELKKSTPDIQMINQELWDQAIIWPVRHYNNGFWVNKNAHINYEELNTNHPAIDFQFIKWNK